MNAVKHLPSPEKCAVGYLRCSTENQEDSPDQQKRAIQEYAAGKGLTILDWFLDKGKSGTTFERRPEFMRLKGMIDQSPPFATVICYDESRWGRAIDAEENTYWRFYFRNRGVDVQLVKTSVDQSNDFAPMLSAFEGVQASMYSKKLSEVTLRGALNNAEYSNGGTAPYGYVRIAINTKTGNERTLQPGEWCTSGQEKVKWGLGDELEIDTVRFIFAERAKGLAYLLIAQSLNTKRVPCPKRGRWKSKDQKWSHVTIKTIIENHAYYGARVYNRNSMSKIIARQRNRSNGRSHSYPHWVNPKSEWTITENAHPAIVTKEVWEQANSIRKGEPKIRSNRYTHRSPYLLTGLIRCSRCGFAFQGMSSKARGKPYPRYVDGGWQNKRVCSHLGIRKELLEDFAIKAVKETISDPNIIEQINQMVQSLMEGAPKEKANEVEAIKRAIVQNNEKIQNLMTAIEGGTAVERLGERIEELERDQHALKRRLVALETQEPSTIDPGVIKRRVMEYIENFETEIERAPMEEKKILMKKMISKIDVDRDNNVVRFHVRRLPAVTPELDELLQKERVAADVATTQSSGGPNFLQVATRYYKTLEYAYLNNTRTTL